MADSDKPIVFHDGSETEDEGLDPLKFKDFLGAEKKELNVKTELSEDAVTCAVCGVEVDSTEILQGHIEVSEQCGLSYPKRELESLQEQSEGWQPFGCSVCARRFTSKSSLLKHVSRAAACKEGLKASSLKESSDEFSQSSEEEEEEEEEDDCAEVCLSCERTFLSLKSLSKHLSTRSDCKQMYTAEDDTNLLLDDFTSAKVTCGGGCRKTFHAAISLRKHLNKSDSCTEQKASSSFEMVEGTMYAEAKERARQKAEMRLLEDSNGKRTKQAVGTLVDDSSSLVCSAGQCVKGASKIDHEDEEDEEPLLILPPGTYLATAVTASASDIPLTESLVAMSLSGDDESVEVRYLVHKRRISLPALQRALHAVMAVTGHDCKALVESHLPLIPRWQSVKAKDRISKEIYANGMKLAEADPPEGVEVSCQQGATAETHFLSAEMSVQVPCDQLLLNDKLSALDTAAVGLQVWQEGRKALKLLPLFSVNDDEDEKSLTERLGVFYQVLNHWLGGKGPLTELLLRLPCIQAAKNTLMKELASECLSNCQAGRTQSICERCGQCLEYNKFVISEVRAIKAHQENHDLSCPVCHISHPTRAAKKYCQRSHRPDSVPCTKCHFVANSEATLETHVKFVHVPCVCQACGKELTSYSGLQSHLLHVHNKDAAPRRWYDSEPAMCPVCSKWYSTHKIMRRHRQKHDNPSSSVNRSLPLDDPSRFLFLCPVHDNCQRYFKSKRNLVEHLRKYRNKVIPPEEAVRVELNVDEAMCQTVDPMEIFQEEGEEEMPKQQEQQAGPPTFQYRGPAVPYDAAVAAQHGFKLHAPAATNQTQQQQQQLQPMEPQQGETVQSKTET